MTAVRYDPAGTARRNAAMPGAVALRHVVMTAFRVTDSGILRDAGRCPPYGARSEHCEGRAWDAGILPEYGEEGDRLAAWCVEHHVELGIQSVIWQRRVWGFGSDVWRPYHGPSPHTDHVHIGLHKAAAATLTIRQVQDALPPAASVEEEEMTAEQVQWVQDALFELRKDVAIVRERTDATYDIVNSLRPTVDELADRLRRAHEGDPT